MDAAASAPDKLTISQGSAAARAAEEKVAQTRQAQDSNSRVAELSKNILIDDNWFKGGNYTVCCYDVNAASNVKVTNNTFYSGSAKFGFGNIFDGVLWSGNKTNTGATATTKMK